jgi:hypothetical protein
MRRLILAVPLSVGQLTAFSCLGAVCIPPPAPRGFPSPETATEQEIATVRIAVKRYLADMENTLECFDAAHQDYAHNMAVDDMERTAAKFNALLRAFRTHQKP